MKKHDLTRPDIAMNTITAPRMDFLPKQRSAGENRGRIWAKLFEIADPLAAWKSEFSEWCEDVKSFRVFEAEHFFADHNNELISRIHRGSLCNLISFGELLVVELLTKHGENEGTLEQVRFVDTFLKNLQSTMDTWHAVDHDVSQNPLAELLVS